MCKHDVDRLLQGLPTLACDKSVASDIYQKSLRTPQKQHANISAWPHIGVYAVAASLAFIAIGLYWSQPAVDNIPEISYLDLDTLFMPSEDELDDREWQQEISLL